MKKYAIIVAGGKGQRMNADLPKQFILLSGKPLLMYTIEAFYKYDKKIKIVLVLPSSQIDYWKNLCVKYYFTYPIEIVEGGHSRFHSVKNGLSSLKENGLVAIHDGVRPFVSIETITRCFSAANEFGNAIPVIDIVDSIRHIEGDRNEAVDRNQYKLVQTPQVFEIEKLKTAYAHALTVETSQFTDDASVFSFAGYKIHLVEGNRENIKITTPFDLLLAESMSFFTKELKFLQGVGPKKADILQKELHINSIEDLLYYYPYKYIDRSRIFYIHELSGNMPYVQLKGKISHFCKVGEGRNARYTAQFTDGTGKIELVWFKGIKYIEGKYKSKEDYLVFGKPNFFNGVYSIVHPEIDEISPENETRNVGLQAFYNTTEKMKSSFLNSKTMQKIMFSAVQELRANPLTETLPAYLLNQYHFLPLNQSLFNIHFPQNLEILNKAEKRLKFEELFYIQLSILRKAKEREQNIKGFVFSVVGNYFNTFYKEYLPFELTNAQKKVIKEIRADVRTGKQMNRLLQGDVGSGKTLVALMSMLIAVDNGFQACIMAPTEILAIQHYQGMSAMLKDLGVTIERKRRNS